MYSSLYPLFSLCNQVTHLGSEFNFTTSMYFMSMTLCNLDEITERSLTKKFRNCVPKFAINYIYKATL